VTNGKARKLCLVQCTYTSDCDQESHVTSLRKHGALRTPQGCPCQTHTAAQVPCKLGSAPGLLLAPPGTPARRRRRPRTACGAPRPLGWSPRRVRAVGTLVANPAGRLRGQLRRPPPALAPVCTRLALQCSNALCWHMYALNKSIGVCGGSNNNMSSYISMYQRYRIGGELVALFIPLTVISRFCSRSLVKQDISLSGGFLAGSCYYLNVHNDIDPCSGLSRSFKHYIECPKCWPAVQSRGTSEYICCSD
jgi:hypothetical protein